MVLLAAAAVVLLLVGGVNALTGGAGDTSPTAAQDSGTAKDAGRAGGKDAGKDPKGDQGGQAQPGTMPTAAASPTGGAASPSPTQQAKAAGAAACTAKSLQVTATADASSYSKGATPKLGLLIRNVGKEDCSLDAGSAAVELLIVSGKDRIWSSDDCQKGGTSNVQVLKPGAELASSVQWPMQRSAAGCPPDLPAPNAGTYQVTGRVGKFTSQPLVFKIS
jgi:archaellum component FlaG (FlaF/FlaG flagellin family)